MNSCTFTGRLVADAEMKTTNSGKELCSFRVASDTGWGERKKTHWLSCALFGERGAKLAPYLKKGDPITVVGDLDPPRTYVAQGETRVAQDLVVRELAMQGGKKQEGAQDGAGGHGGGTDYRGQGQGQRAPSAPSQGAQGAAFDDDIPF